MEADGARATGVEFVDAATGKTEEARATLVVLCASTLESVRILLNSRSRAHPEGIGASSGVLGRYVMDHSAGNVYFYLPDVPDTGGPYELLGSDSIMIPRYQNLGEQGGRRTSAASGSGAGSSGSRSPPSSAGTGRWRSASSAPARRRCPTPTIASRSTPIVRDRWGIPAAHIVCEWKDADLAWPRAARQAAREIVEAAGGVCAEVTELFHTPGVTGHIRKMQKEWTLSTPGMFVHEVGGARMGDDPNSSVVDADCRCWEVPNLLVTDGACWPTSGWQNPTLTEMAITARACDRAVQELKRSG